MEDERGDIWVSTFDGISHIGMPDFHFTNFDYSNGLQGNSFNNNAFFKSSENELFFGGKSGATHFKASTIKSDRYSGKTNISSFQVQGDNTNLMTDQPSIILQHNQNFFSISFMISNYLNTAKNKFEYQLVGLDHDWISTNSTQAIYTNVPPGKYTFQVRGMNEMGISSAQASILKIIIRKPWYFSNWLLFLYLLITMGISYLIYLSLIRRKKLKEDLVIKDLEKEKLLEMDRLRSELLSNISHEIRTPLNLILSPVDMLRNNVPEKQKLKLLNVIAWNAHRLLFMVNQILDLSLVDAHQLRLTMSHVYLDKILEPILITYQSYAINEGRIFRWTIPDEPLLVRVDVEKFEKIILNLLSNAFKFSGDDGEVIFSAIHTDTGDKPCLKISVTDNGVGIREEEQGKIFSRFYSSKTNNHQGIGIGLALTKQLVEMHSGTIEVSSEPEKYTRFDIFLPICADKDSRPENLVSKANTPPYLPLPEAGSLEGSTETIPVKQKDFTILIVEDDRGLREILANLLEDRYNLIQVYNGNEALKKIEKESIDLIITDLVMPGMDGMELIRNLKGKPETINIPVIILSARQNPQGKLDAMQLGVEAFLEKPFNNTELLTQINNILLLRMRLNEAIHHSHLVDKSKVLNISGDNEVFINQLESILHLNLTNPQFSVEFLADSMNISRVQLHRKLKSILGISVSEFIRNYRLQLAAQYILSGKTRMTQIAYEVGFNNPSYFAEQFKKLFGCIPSEYKNKFS